MNFVKTRMKRSTAEDNQTQQKNKRNTQAEEHLSLETDFIKI